jgi:hypothetical protein
MRKFFATLFLTVALAVGAVAPTASAAPVVTGGLVNVTVTDVLNNNTVTVTVPIGVAANVAANVCGVAVGVLVQDFRNDGNAVCSTATQTASITQLP